MASFKVEDGAPPLILWPHARVVAPRASLAVMAFLPYWPLAVLAFTVMVIQPYWPSAVLAPFPPSS